ncbi:DUF1653 domain-containing protein [Candidatus Parcubacteria bacterium]|nr:DUF1653 domain-containing protein [Candidatus Parcubacteria bacterium]
MDKLKLGKYQHFKGKLYEVVGTARHSETLEELVVYKALYTSKEFGSGSFWVRPKAMFLGKAELNSKKVPRFKFIS